MANLLPHVDLYFPGTAKLMAKLFFRTSEEADQFKEKSLCPLSITPICIIYLDALYWKKGKPFLFNNELQHFFPAEINCLDWIAYRQLYREILFISNIIKDAPDAPEKYNQSDHQVDALAYRVHGYAFEPSFYRRPLENKIIDQMDLPALENSLNEAVRIENYEAAAHIKNKIEARDCLIIEYQGWLKIRRRAPDPEVLNGKDYKNLFFPSD